MFNPERDNDSRDVLAEHIRREYAPLRVPASSLELYSDEFGAYRDGSTFAKLPRRLEINDILERIDSIPNRLVACLKLEELYKAVSHSYWCRPALQRGITYALPDTNKDSDSPRYADLENRNQYCKKKKMTRGQAPTLTTLMSCAIRRLADPQHSHLFDVCDEASKWKLLGSRVDVSAFFVEKAGQEKLLRVIIDGRWSNLVYHRADATFSFFSFEQLRQVIDNLCKDENGNTRDWYALNFDLRHWFHEIPLPDRYREIFAIPLTDQGLNRGDYYLFPRALPMGWSFSPFVAQCITWALVLSRHPELDKTKELPRISDVDLKALAAVTDPFTWIPLRSGGGIFVLLDNILVVTPREDVATFWFEQIVNNAVKYDAHLKFREDPQREPKVTPRTYLKEQCFKHLSASDNSQSFEFLGVEWFHHCHRLIPKEGEDKSLPNVDAASPNMASEDSVWTGTHRQLASVIGRLMWYRRVYNLSFLDDAENVYGTQTLLDLFPFLTPGDTETWNSLISLTPVQSRGLVRAWRARSAALPCPADPLLLPKDGTLRTFWFATDAAKDDNINLNSWSVVRYPEGRSIKNPLGVGVSPSVSTGSFPAHYNIACGELYAIYQAVISVSEPNSLIVLATDSQNAKSWVETRKTSSSEARELLRHIFDHLRQHKQRIYLVYVRSENNVADYSTRPHPEDPTRTHHDKQYVSTGKSLLFAEQQALATWLNVAGHRSGGVVNSATTVPDSVAED
jgi:hypothetical protein